MNIVFFKIKNIVIRIYEKKKKEINSLLDVLRSITI